MESPKAFSALGYLKKQSPQSAQIQRHIFWLRGDDKCLFYLVNGYESINTVFFICLPMCSCPMYPADLFGEWRPGHHSHSHRHQSSHLKSSTRWPGNAQLLRYCHWSLWHNYRETERRPQDSPGTLHHCLDNRRHVLSSFFRFPLPKQRICEAGLSGRVSGAKDLGFNPPGICFRPSPSPKYHPWGLPGNTWHWQGGHNHP